jgi:hypothetical protein
LQGEFTSFRARFLPFAVILAVIAVVGALAGYFGGSGENPNANSVFLLLGLPCLAALGAGIGILTVLYYRVQVAPWGVRGFDVWGSYHNVTWGEMVEARPLNLLGLRYLRVRRAGGGSSL